MQDLGDDSRFIEIARQRGVTVDIKGYSLVVRFVLPDVTVALTWAIYMEQEEFFQPYISLDPPRGTARAAAVQKMTSRCGLRTVVRLANAGCVPHLPPLPVYL